jgi:hypothetical protein
LVINAGENVIIGSGSIEEFSNIFADNTKNMIKDAIETGEISIRKG